MSGHSTLPWRVGGRPSLKVWSDFDNEVVSECWMVAGTKGEANAALIVRSVNAHHQLVEALEKIADIIKRNKYHQWEKIEDAESIARAALASAKGTSE